VNEPETRPRWVRQDALVLFPAGVTIAVALVWAATGGGYEARPVLGAAYDPSLWYLGALVLVGLLCATRFGLAHVRISRWATIACAAVLAYTAWSFLSVLWAHDQGTAFLGSDRTLVYAAAFVTFAILPWSSRTLGIALASFVAGVGVLAVVTTARLALLADPSSLYLNARLVYPLGYYDADAALFMTAAVTAVALCSRRSGPIVLRVSGLAIAAVCLQLAVLGQSRGWLFTAPIILALTLLIVPGRLRLLFFALGPALATAAATPTLLHVYGRATAKGVTLLEPRLHQVLHQQGLHAARAMLIADLVLALLATPAVILDRRLSLSERATRQANRIGAALAIGALLAGVVVGLVATHGHVIGRVEGAWRSFVNTSEGAAGASRFTSLGSQRVDFWRVGLREWANHPLLGLGQDNYASAYLRLRHTEQEPRWVHSLELRLLVHTGLVGALLFGLFVVAAFVAALGARARGPGNGLAGSRRVAAGIALLPFVVWLVHGSIDWFWEFPALSVPALAFAGAAGAVRASAGPLDARAGAPVVEQVGTPAAEPVGAQAGSRQQSTRRGVRPATALYWGMFTLFGLAALAAIAIPFAAAREVQKAVAVWPQNPSLAYGELHSAAKLMPFDMQIDLVGGAIGLNLGEAASARGWFEKAQRRDDQEWLAPFALGVIESELGRTGPAAVQLRRAHELNPQETVVNEALSRLHTPHPLTFEQAQEILSARGVARFGR
jgi:hypothetical protein